MVAADNNEGSQPNLNTIFWRLPNKTKFKKVGIVDPEEQE